MPLRAFIAASLALAGLAGTTAVAATPAPKENLRAALAAALLAEDPVAIRATVAAAVSSLGERAGEPEVADRYTPAPAAGRWLTPAEAQLGFAPHFERLEKLVWWRIGLDPTEVTGPLRQPASILAGGVAAARARLDGAERGLALAKDAAGFLQWTQTQAGAGLFPFPAARASSTDRAMQVGADFLAHAERAGQLARVVKNGWAVDDLGNGGLQFDNAECGVAMFEFYEFTADRAALISARRAADWAVRQPLVTNWNYNSFSVWLLAKAHTVTGDADYLAAAKKKALLGVIPGQLTAGPRAGRWADPHNARPAYHYIMLRALAQLVVVLPANDPDRPAIMRSLQLGLVTRNAEFSSLGIMNRETAMETLLFVRQAFAQDPGFLTITRSTTALDVLAPTVSADVRRGHPSLSPRAWGQFLAYAKSRAAAPTPPPAPATGPQTLTVGGLTRTYHLHLPPAYDGRTALPLVLMLHGTGGTAESTLRETGWTALADAENFILVLPEATRPDPASPPRFGRNNPAWNDGSGRFHSGERAVPDAAFVAALLDRLQATLAVDPSRTYATGFSNGASMVFRLGLELPGRFAAIAPVAGALWIGPPAAAALPPLLYLTGDQDPLNPIAGGVPGIALFGGRRRADPDDKAKAPVRDHVRKWSAALGCDPVPQAVSGTPRGVTTERYVGSRHGAEVVFTVIAGHGHIWPGGKNSLPEWMVGKPTSPIQATEVIWEFFQRHTLPTPPPASPR